MGLKQNLGRLQQTVMGLKTLDVLLALCDRIMVISSGYVTGIVDARTATKEEIGLLMTKTDSVNVSEEKEEA